MASARSDEALESAGEPFPNAVHERIDTLRAELSDAPISKGSQESLAALRAEFRRKHLALEDEVPSGLSLPALPILSPRVLLVAVALIAGCLAAWLALGSGSDEANSPAPVEQAEPAPAPEAPTVEVLVAKATIAVGTRITPDVLEWQKWPESAARGEYLTASASPDAISQLTGSVARTEVLAGEPIRREKLGQAGAGYLSAILEPGKRAVAVPINPRSASGGFIMPNDRVDVVLTNEQGSRTILENVRVLAIDARLGPSDTEAAEATPEQSVLTGDALATLELDPSQAELMISASNSQLSLVLRPTSDTASPPDAARRAINQNIRLTSPFWLQTPQPGVGGMSPAFPEQR